MDVSALGLSAPYASVLTVVLVVGPFIWVVSRSRSLFMVRQRLWRLLHHRADGQEAWLDEAVRERFELMRFRALVMWADSLAEARRLTEFARGRGIDVGVLGDCGKYFNRHKLALRDKLPSLLGRKALAGIGRAILAGAIAISAAHLLDDGTYLRLRHDGTWFVATQTSARPVWSDTGNVMTVDDCKAGTDRAGFGEQNRAIVCRTLGADDLKSLLREGLLVQRVLLVVLMLTLAAAIGSVQHSLSALRAAWATRAWLSLDPDSRAGLGGPRVATPVNGDPPPDAGAAVTPTGRGASKQQPTPTPID
ncbi:DUF6216 family protein [Luteibacter sp. 9133]|uniref:DUF6216 family protein n=1 Tax=Luteibacter sp. 9133 TaxID=1500891 RepID=UPI0005BE5B9F|nr:DUF6216 family protein [Luteibacter sp. 9133]